MPVVIAVAIRALIQAAVTTGIWLFVEKALLPYLKDAVQDYMVNQGMTEEEAKDNVANEIIDMVALFGTLAITIRSKFPVKAAEYLGFTTKGWAKRGLFAKAVVATEATTVATVATTATGAALATQNAVQKISIAKSTVKGAGKAFKFLEGRLNTIFLGFLAVSGFIDFGNWETGAYSDSFQKLFEKISFGLLVPNQDFRQTKTTSPEVFTKVFETYKMNGAVSIKDPYKKMEVPFTRDNMIDLVDKVGAEILMRTGSASTKDVLLATQLMINFDVTKMNVGSTIGSSSTLSPTLSTGYSQAYPKVYSGIVTQGVVGKGLSFEARPDDLIESLEELKSAAANNLAPYLQSLLSKIVYEIKIVSTYIAKDGTTMRGMTQQVKNGVDAQGKTKFKTVTNKFATLNVYAVTDKGARSKLTTIVLGPTNSAKLLINQNDVIAVEQGLPALVTTSNINEIAGIETAGNVTVSTPKTEGDIVSLDDVSKTGEVIKTVDTSPVGTSDVAGNAAQSLTEWFNAQGKELASLEVRAQMYSVFGLGPASYYTGTAEQNTKLLMALKNTKAVEQKKETEKKETEKKETAKKTSSTSKEKTVTRIYTTTGGERVTKYSDGTEKRVKIKK